MQKCAEKSSPWDNKTVTPNAGFSSFVANVVTFLQIVGITVPKKYDIWQRKGVQLSVNLLKTFVLPEKGIYILGNNILYAPALYASLQISEFFGSTAVAHKLEEFCHSPIFGFKKTHNLWSLRSKWRLIIYFYKWFASGFLSYWFWTLF